MNPILNQTQPQLQPGQVSQIFQILQASANPTAAIQALIATNPACSQVLPIIYKNGVAYSAPISETVGDATSTHSLAVNALVQVPQNDCKCNACTSPTVLTVQNVGNAATVTMNVTVNKIA